MFLSEVKTSDSDEELPDAEDCHYQCEPAVMDCPDAETCEEANTPSGNEDAPQIEDLSDTELLEQWQQSGDTWRDLKD